MAKEYNIAKATGSCLLCERQLQPDEEFVATVREIGDELRREDYCMACWQGRDGRVRDGEGELFGQWVARVPQPKEKKKLFVDDEVLVNFFRRLDGAEDAARISFRFVLTLLLMRKKLLAYRSSRKLEDGREVWTLRFKGSDEEAEVIDPGMDEDQVAEVSAQLGQILEAEL